MGYKSRIAIKSCKRFVNKPKYSRVKLLVLRSPSKTVTPYPASAIQNNLSPNVCPHLKAVKETLFTYLVPHNNFPRHVSRSSKPTSALPLRHAPEPHLHHLIGFEIVRIKPCWASIRARKSLFCIPRPEEKTVGDEDILLTDAAEDV